MRGFCGQRKTDAYAWAAADAKPTPMRGPRPMQKKNKIKSIYASVLCPM